MRILTIIGICSFGLLARAEDAPLAKSVPEKPDLLGYATHSRDIDSIVSRIGVTKSEDGRRRFAFCPEITYHKVPLATSEANVRLALQAADENDVPVVFKLVGNRYWDDRPDLWNWWAPDQPGYNPKNIENVEWYGWGAKHATKMSWVKWGPGPFIPLPPNPNLASPAYIQADKEKLDVLLPIIMEWYRKLPPERKYLLGGVLFGWELQADHVGSFFKGYEADDIYSWKERKTEDRPEVMEEMLQLGFAAATTLKLQDGEGKQLADQSVAAIMRHYFGRLTDIAVEHGVPADKIILHGVGYGAKNHGTLLDPDSQVIPGWTTYNSQPHDFDYIIDSRGDRPWAAAEFGGRFDLNRLEYYTRRNCRAIILYARNGHLTAANNRTVRQWLGYPDERADPVTLPYAQDFETGLDGWTSVLSKAPGTRTDSVAFKGQWSLRTGANQASEIMLFEEPRAAVIEFYLLDSNKIDGRSGLIDFRGDGESNLRLGTFQTGWWNVRQVGESFESATERRDGWRHVRAVFDGEQARLYMDGELIATDPNLGKVRDVSVGWYWHNSTGFEWDEFRVTEYRGEEYDRTRDSQLRQDFERENTQALGVNDDD